MPSADHQDLLVFLLDVVEGMVDLFEWGLLANSELGHARFAAQVGYVVDDGLDLVGVEVQALDL